MTNPKGTAFETPMLNYQQQFSAAPLWRPRLSGVNDIGDIVGWPGLTQELKNCKVTNLALWAKEAEREMEKAGNKLWWILHKRRGVGDPGLQWVTMPQWGAMELLLSWIEPGGSSDLVRGD